MLRVIFFKERVGIPMALYEVVFILRQDIAVQDVNKISQQFEEILSEGGAKILKKESWGLRSLAYIVKKNKKGHYIMLGVDSDIAVVNELARRLKISEDVIGHQILRVENIDENPSPMLQAPAELKHGSSDLADAI
jgi:small subunit ribosomal protein S6